MPSCAEHHTHSIEDSEPARVDAATMPAWHTRMRERQHACAGAWRDVDAHARRDTWRHRGSKRELQAPVRGNLDISPAMLGHSAAMAFSEAKVAADSRIDRDFGHRVVRSREQPRSRARRIEPGREQVVRVN